MVATQTCDKAKAGMPQKGRNVRRNQHETANAIDITAIRRADGRGPFFWRIGFQRLPTRRWHCSGVRRMRGLRYFPHCPWTVLQFLPPRPFPSRHGGIRSLPMIP